VGKKTVLREEAIVGFLEALHEVNGNGNVETDEQVHGVTASETHGMVIVAVQAWTVEKLGDLMTIVGTLAGKHHMNVLEEWTFHQASFWSAARRFVVEQKWIDQEAEK